MASTLCRVLYYSNLAYGAKNQIELEVATSSLQSVADGAQAVCLTPPYNLTKTSFQVQQVTSGGTQFQDATSEQSWPSLQSSVKLFTLPDLLARDPYFDTSYRAHRCVLLGCISLAADAPSSWAWQTEPHIATQHRRCCAHCQPRLCRHMQCCSNAISDFQQQSVS
jgi:hypothetical protein